MKKLLALFGLMLCLYKPTTQAQFLSGIIINKFDKNALHHGKWKYIDKAHKRRLMCLGRFDHGKQVGIWHYYYPSGKLRMVEKYTWQGEKRLVDVTFFHEENGQVSNRGQAFVETEANKTHYYWFGDWAYFSHSGELVKTVTYNNGQPIRSVYPDGYVEVEMSAIPPSAPIELPMP